MIWSHLVHPNNRKPVTRKWIENQHKDGRWESIKYYDTDAGGNESNSYTYYLCISGYRIEQPNENTNSF